MSLAAAEPGWSLLGALHADQLPGLRWKALNLEKLNEKNPSKFAEQTDALAERLSRL